MLDRCSADSLPVVAVAGIRFPVSDSAHMLMSGREFAQISCYLSIQSEIAHWSMHVHVLTCTHMHIYAHTCTYMQISLPALRRINQAVGHVGGVKEGGRGEG